MRKRFEYVYFQKSKVIGWALNKIKPGVKPTVMPFEEQWDFRKKILDVGCGAGTFICQLRKIGFEHVSGIDPFISFDTVYPNGISVEKKRITDLDEQYDIVYSHDVFEHVDDPAESLTAMRKCLKPGGVCIMVFPGVNAMYKRYKKDSYVIQAPQHYFLHSYRSLEIVAAKAGLKVASMKCEGNYLWYLKSELLVQETAFGETDSSDELEANFAQKELTKLKRIAQEDTQTNTGDGYSVLLVPTR
jgi:SAM-dependent methyltransferase